MNPISSLPQNAAVSIAPYSPNDEVVSDEFASLLIDTETSETEKAANEDEKNEKDEEIRQALNQFVGETFFRQMMKSLRSTTGEVPYLDGGRAEEIFTSQLDQHLVEQMAEQHGGQFSQGMFELFTAARR